MATTSPFNSRSSADDVLRGRDLSGQVIIVTGANTGIGYETARSLAARSATDRLHLADFAAGGFQSADYWDVIHWLQPGADRAAHILFEAIQAGPLGG